MFRPTMSALFVIFSSDFFVVPFLYSLTKDDAGGMGANWDREYPENIFLQDKDNNKDIKV